MAFGWEVSAWPQGQPLTTVLLLGAANENGREDAEEADGHGGHHRGDDAEHRLPKFADVLINSVEAVSHRVGQIVQPFVGPG